MDTITVILKALLAIALLAEFTLIAFWILDRVHGQRRNSWRLK